MTGNDKLSYRIPTPEELQRLDPRTPGELDRRVFIDCPTGKVEDAKITYEDGEPLINVMRTIISLESVCIRTPDGKFAPGIARVYIQRFNNEIGRVEFLVADVLVGRNAL